MVKAAINLTASVFNAALPALLLSRAVNIAFDKRKVVLLCLTDLMLRIFG